MTQPIRIVSDSPERPYSGPPAERARAGAQRASGPAGVQGARESRESRESRGASRVGCDEGLSIDCDTCPVRAIRCDDCVVSVLLGAPELPERERAAVSLLADHGLVPPLRDPRSAAGSGPPG